MNNGAAPLLDPVFLKRLERMEVGSRRFTRGTYAGNRRSRLLGHSTEFADYRSYTPGDDIRQIDWFAYARLGKWFLKMFLDERELNIHLFIDCSRSMAFGQPSKGQRAIEFAAAIGYIGLSNWDRMTVTAFDQQIKHKLPPQHGKANIHTLFSFLQQVTFTERGDMAKALAEASALPRQAGLTIVLTDGWFEGGYERPLSRLQGVKQQVAVVQMTTGEERDPAYQGDLRLIDSETGQYEDVAMSPYVLRRYRNMYTAYTGALREWCFRRGISYIPVAVEDPLETVVFTIFRRAGLIG